MFYDLKDKKPKNSGENWVAPNATIIGDVTLEKNSSIWFNAVLRGDIENIYIGEGSNVQDGSVLHTDPGYPLKIGKNVTIEPYVVIGKNVKIGNNVIIKSFSHLEACKIENKVEIGPYARIRPDTILKEGSKIGNFVEVKKSIVGKKSKVNHLSYIGDSEIGKSVNIGAGTITCNYDGVKKSKTKIKDNVFVGSNSSLVAPLTIEKESIIGAGSVITKNVKKQSLALTRSSQTEIKNYKRK